MRDKIIKHVMSNAGCFIQKAAADKKPLPNSIKQLFFSFPKTQNSTLAEIGNSIIDHFNRTGSDIAGLVSRWDDADKKALVARLSLTDEHWDRDGCMNLIKQFEASVRRQDKALLKRIDAAEKSGDDKLLAQLLQEKQHQARQIMETQRGMKRGPL